MHSNKKAGCANNTALEQTSDAGGNIQAIKARQDAQQEIGAVMAAERDMRDAATAGDPMAAMYLREIDKINALTFKRSSPDYLAQRERDLKTGAISPNYETTK